MKITSLLLLFAFFAFTACGQCEKCIKVIDTRTLMPLDSMYVAAYDVNSSGFGFNNFDTTDRNGRVILKISPERYYKIHIKDLHRQIKYPETVKNVQDFSGDTLVMKVDRVVRDRYIKVVYRNSEKPLDSMEVSFYKVFADNIIFVDYAITDINGLVIVPESFGTDSNFTGKINTNALKIAKDNYHHYWPAVENITGLLKDTIIIKLDYAVGPRIRFENVYFAFNSDSLIAFYLEKLSPEIETLRENPGLTLEIIGHADNKEESGTADKLSRKRAENVKSYLISRGIDKDRLITKALGSSMPIVPNEKDGQDDPEGRALNRRVEFHIIASPEPDSEK